jgi:hypothetical protein
MAPDEPFRVTFYLAGGEERTFPIQPGVIRGTIERSTQWPDPPFTQASLERLGERDGLFRAIVALYGHMVRKPDGAMFFLTADDGSEWAFPARSVLAFRLEDPTTTWSRLDRDALGDQTWATRRVAWSAQETR